MIEAKWKKISLKNSNDKFCLELVIPTVALAVMKNKPKIDYFKTSTDFMPSVFLSRWKNLTCEL